MEEIRLFDHDDTLAYEISNILFSTSSWIIQFLTYRGSIGLEYFLE